ncbi:antibiotic biosynthesis monooxygenase [Frondihabitans sp. VKM Ac-2883]|uniref:antibiotic biosynthesis monooxygenase family protein n=1 Tax=Frondihabitans sp. VKM Ac-2883 TaxID=2783823 RepID=UPI00188B3B29|nr:antibiotic biosynthesis monooxygenase [Frondihabitans sp. VKM Ac-2883]MBF4575221.1 antibiotic biosynthesis monooxygenase [Frondihabitans sp. VKM Ac-2883]
MSVVKINAIHVPEGQGAELEKRFAARKHSVDGSKGFEGFQLLRPVKGEERYFVVTTWDSEESFQEWSANGAKAAHGQGAQSAPAPDTSAASEQPTAPKPVATGADLLEFEVVEL